LLRLSKKASWFQRRSVLLGGEDRCFLVGVEPFELDRLAGFLQVLQLPNDLHHQGAEVPPAELGPKAELWAKPYVTGCDLHEEPLPRHDITGRC